MNRKISVGVCISLMAIACTVTFVVTWTVSFNTYNSIIPNAVQREEISSKLNEIDAFVQNNALFPPDMEKVAHGVFSGYIAGLGDKNTIYMNAEEFLRLSAYEKGRLVTSGVRGEAGGDAGQYIAVAEVYPGSNAEASGIEKGDLITSINGTDVLETGADLALRLLEGDENTRVTIVVQRDGTEQEHILIRQAIDIVSVEHGVVNDIGIARITAINERTAAQFDAALQDFVQEGVRALLVDLRSCSGGVYSSVHEMADSLIGAESDAANVNPESPSVVRAYTVHKGEVRRDFTTTDDYKVFSGALPLVVLVNETTSGPGELMAALLQRYANAQVVGGSTAGNAYLQQTQQLKDGSAVRVTTAKIILADGFDYATTGVTPTNPIEMSGEPSYKIEDLWDVGLADVQIRKAFEIIETMSS